VGKSSVFNALTGESQYVSNWPGKTWEGKAGIAHHPAGDVQVVDLPGTYSLTANSAEERIARDYLLQSHPDVVVVIVDATALERNLYLVAELMHIELPLVVGLNRIDLAAERGIEVEPHVLEAALGIPVIPMIANHSQGTRELLDGVVRISQEPQEWKPNRPSVRDDHRSVLEQIETLIRDCTPPDYPQTWVAIKLFEGDEEIIRLMQQRMREGWQQLEKILAAHEDAFLTVASGRYDWIGRMVRVAVVRPKPGQLSMTDRIDRVATHPFWGILMLLGIVGGLFWLTYAIGAPLQNWMDRAVVQGGGQWLRGLLAGSPDWIRGLFVDGIFTGVGSVLTLLPILAIFFLFLGLLEDVGYMARAAFVMDRFMHVMGLHGKSFLPIFLGFGCNVPAVMGTRIIESPKARLITILITPLVPCTARFSVIAFLAPVFFPNRAVWVTWFLIGASLATLFVLGWVLHEWFLGGEHTVFIMELPLYQKPDFHSIRQGFWGRIVDFLKMAGSIILVVSVLMWVLSTFPGGRIEESYLAQFGKLLTPIGAWMGLDWPMMVALLTSFVRKENTIPTLAVLYGAGGNGMTLVQALSGTLLPAAALAFLTVQVLFIPCVATVGAIRQETASWRWTLLSVFLLLVISLSAGVAIFQTGRLMGWGV